MRPSVSTLRGFFYGWAELGVYIHVNQKIISIKLIKLTSAVDGKAVYINTECIGHFYPVAEKKEYGRVVKDAHTRVGVTTHNNGGFEVAEDCDQIFKLIEKAK